MPFHMCSAFTEMKCCLFSFTFDFMAKTQNPLIHNSRFKEFMIPSLDDFIDGDETDCCCLSSELLGNTVPEWSSTVLGFPSCSFQQLRGRNNRPKPHFVLD